MKHLISYILLTLISIQYSRSQESLSDLLAQYNTESIPYISVEDLALSKTEAVILDARELREYQVSHLKNAKHVGYDNFKLETVLNFITDKDKKIVVYCSLGIRSEDISEHLKKAGYTNVHNLFGGVFEWINQEHKVFDASNEETKNIHAFSSEWGKWLTKGKKVYNK